MNGSENEKVVRFQKASEALIDIEAFASDEMQRRFNEMREKFIAKWQEEVESGIARGLKRLGITMEQLNSGTFGQFVIENCRDGSTIYGIELAGKTTVICTMAPMFRMKPEDNPNFVGVAPV